MSCTQHNKACKSCPFSRNCESGALGGSSVATYLGQILGNFYLPCHAAANYLGNDTPISSQHVQCAGAALFRQNIGTYVPDPLLKIEGGEDDNVFKTLEEFIAHHEPEFTPAFCKEVADIARTGVFTQMEVHRAAMKGKPIQSAAEVQSKFNQ